MGLRETFPCCVSNRVSTVLAELNTSRRGVKKSKQSHQLINVCDVCLTVACVFTQSQRSAKCFLDSNSWGKPHRLALELPKALARVTHTHVTDTLTLGPLWQELLGPRGPELRTANEPEPDLGGLPALHSIRADRGTPRVQYAGGPSLRFTCRGCAASLSVFQGQCTRNIPVPGARCLHWHSCLAGARAKNRSGATKLGHVGS